MRSCVSFIRFPYLSLFRFILITYWTAYVCMCVWECLCFFVKKRWKSFLSFGLIYYMGVIIMADSLTTSNDFVQYKYEIQPHILDISFCFWIYKQRSAYQRCYYFCLIQWQPYSILTIRKMTYIKLVYKSVLSASSFTLQLKESTSNKRLNKGIQLESHVHQILYGTMKFVVRSGPQ